MGSPFASALTRPQKGRASIPVQNQSGPKRPGRMDSRGRLSPHTRKNQSGPKRPGRMDSRGRLPPHTSKVKSSPVQNQSGPKRPGRMDSRGRLSPHTSKVKSPPVQNQSGPKRGRMDSRGRLSPHGPCCYRSVCYVPSLQPAKYSSCSGVSLSILILIDSSFNFATRLSRSSGTL